MIRFLTLLIVILAVTACSVPSLDEVLSDTRTDYKKSKTLPPLDVPPDLSTTESDGTMAIPGEGTTTTTLKDYENRNKRQAQPVADANPTPQQAGNINTTPAILAAPAATPILDSDGGSFISARGDKAEVWDKLREFMAGKGYKLDLDDIELGYMETQWSIPVTDNGHTYRYKFKVYSEASEDPGVTSLYVDNEQQEQVALSNGNLNWIDRNKSVNVERMMAGEMNIYFNGQPRQQYQQQVGSVSTTAAAVASQEPVAVPVSAPGGQAQIQDIGNDKILLAIPEEYTLAWRRTGDALQMAGLVINSSDQDKGLYQVTYRGAREKDKGWTSKLKKLKFWGKDEDQGKIYQIALTGVGEKTEIVILDEDGNWEESTNAERILSMIQTQYNKL